MKLKKLAAAAACLIGAAAASVTAFAAGDVAIDAENFPDSVFRDYVSKNFDKDKNGSLSEEEINNVETISLNGTSSNKISDITGINVFENLKKLVLHYHGLTSLDLENCTSLVYLDCSHNEITNINVKNCAALETLNCSYNEIESIDVSNNIALKELNILTYDKKETHKRLKEIDISKNINLEIFNCGNADISVIDLTYNKNLTNFSCGNTNLTSLDISSNEKLVELNCNNIDLYSLNIEKNTVLCKVYCPDTKINSLNVNKNIALTSLNCANNNISAIDLKNNVNLELINFEHNVLNAIDVSSCTKLEHLYLNSNNLSELNLNNNKSLTILECSSNNLQSLDFSSNDKLIGIECSHNKLTEMNVSNCTDLNGLSFEENYVTTLNIDNNKKLGTLNCNYNKITSPINLDGNSTLRSVYCYNNSIPSISVRNCSNLHWLDCHNNQITELDISSCPNISYCRCNYNYIQKKSDIKGIEKIDEEDYNPQYYKGYDYHYNYDDISISPLKFITNKYINMYISNLSDNYDEELDESIYEQSGGIIFVRREWIPVLSCDDPNVHIENSLRYSYTKVLISKPGEYTVKLTIKNGLSEGNDIVKYFKLTAVEHNGHNFDTYVNIYDENDNNIGHAKECFCGERDKTEPHTFGDEVSAFRDSNNNWYMSVKCTICNYYIEIPDESILTDTDSAIAAIGDTVIDPDAVLDVEPIADMSDIKVYGAVLAYDITLKKDGVEIQPNGKIAVTIPIPDGVKGPITVLRKEADGSYTDMHASAEYYSSGEGYINFVTDHLSVYVVTEESSIKGDLDGDTNINNKDLIILRDIVSKSNADEETVSPAADLNSDSKVNNKDIILMREYLSKQTK